LDVLNFNAAGPLRNELMSDEIKISGEPLGVASMCRFVVDRPVFANRSYYFGSPAAAAVSPLAKRLFEISGIGSVLITHNAITLTKYAPDPWPFVGKLIGAAIRAHIQSGEPAVPEELYNNLPSPDELRRRVEDILQREVMAT